MCIRDRCNSDPTKKSSYDERLYFVFATPLKEHEVWLKAKEGFDDACKEKKIHGDWIGPIAIDTVSYTHLDVYKRQVVIVIAFW